MCASVRSCWENCAVKADEEILAIDSLEDSLDKARELLTFYFGEDAGKKAKLEIEFKVAVYTAHTK